MELRKFNYAGSPREVIITEEDSSSVKGWDVSKLNKEDQRQIWRDLATNTDLSKLTEEEVKTELAKFKELSFRHFKKNKIQ